MKMRKCSKCTYLWAVPSSNTHISTDFRETSNVGLSLPVVLCDEAVGAVRAGERGQGAAAVIVASIVADSDGRSQTGKTKDCR